VSGLLVYLSLILGSDTRVFESLSRIFTASKMLLRDLLAHVMLSAAPVVRDGSISPLHDRSTSLVHDRSAPLAGRGLNHELAALSPGISVNSSPGLSVLATGAAGDCDLGWTLCGTGCMPIGSICCSGKGFCDAGEYCTSDKACCKVGETLGHVYDAKPATNMVINVSRSGRLAPVLQHVTPVRCFAVMGKNLDICNETSHKLTTKQLYAYRSCLLHGWLLRRWRDLPRQRQLWHRQRRWR
jgi:hypothetical protein